MRSAQNSPHGSWEIRSSRNLRSARTSFRQLRGIAPLGHRQVERPPAWRSPGGQISAPDDDASRPLCWPPPSAELIRYAVWLYFRYTVVYRHFVKPRQPVEAQARRQRENAGCTAKRREFGISRRCPVGRPAQRGVHSSIFPPHHAPQFGRIPRLAPSRRDCTQSRWHGQGFYQKYPIDRIDISPSSPQAV
jgi:hypothetical protein